MPTHSLIERLRYELFCLQPGERQWLVVKEAADTIAKLEGELSKHRLALAIAVHERDVLKGLELDAIAERVDAQRYRFLRKGMAGWHITKGPPWDMGHFYEEDVDSRIDVEISNKAPKAQA